MPGTLDESYPPQSSTQEAFGRVLGRLGRLPVGDRVVTFSADVSVTTHLAGWINRKGVYFPRAKPGFAAEASQAVVQWKESTSGQHVELGIAEHNLFLALGAFGLTHELSGTTLLPIGTLYDPFVTRGLDALYHALYAGGRFIVAATPSGVSLSPEGGAHQSVITPGIGVALPAIRYFEPAFAQEVEWILLDGLAPPRRPRARREPVPAPLDQADRSGARAGAVARVSRRGAPRRLSADRRARASRARTRRTIAVHIFAAGVMVPEAVAASRALAAARACSPTSSS